MSGIFGVICPGAVDERKILEDAQIDETINPAGTRDVSVYRLKKGLILNSINFNKKNKNSLFEKYGDWHIFCVGDVIGDVAIANGRVKNCLISKNYDNLSRIDGSYCYVVYNENDNTLFLISDRRCQFPLYWTRYNGSVYFGSEPSSFCRILPCAINKKWFWEYIYFNFPVSDISFIDGVDRVKRCSVLEFNVGDNIEIKNTSYVENFNKKNILLENEQALDYALNVFSDTLPLYYDENDVACALTSGWDGRTVLAFKPDKIKVTAYTYGVPGCQDIERASEIAKIAHVPHVEILFDGDFVTNLPRLMQDTVYLSSGHQGVKRATLLHAYSKLTEYGTKFPLVLSGVFLDCLFRGHAAPPPLISPDIVELFEGRSVGVNKLFWPHVLGDSYIRFDEHITAMLHAITEQFGKVTSPENHLSYLVYLVATRYFSGEMKIANHFTTWRVPAWDNKIIDLAYSIKLSTLNHSQFTKHVRGSREEMILQSYLLKRIAPDLFNIPVGNVKPNCVLRGNLHHLSYKGFQKINRFIFKSKDYGPLEDWNRWLNVDHSEWIDAHINNNSNVCNYLDKNFMSKLIVADKNEHLFGKLLSAEIIIKLVNNGWRKYW